MMHTSRRAPRAAADFPVRRWLRAGAASAGVGAALVAFSVLGPQAPVAGADETGGTSTSAGPSASDSSDTDGATGGGGDTTEQSPEPAETEAADGDADPPARPDEDDEEAGEPDETEPDEPPAKQSDGPGVVRGAEAATDDDGGDDPVTADDGLTNVDDEEPLEPASVPTEPKTARTMETVADAEVVGDAEPLGGDVVETASAPTAAAVSIPVAPRTPGEFVAFAIESWTAASRAWIQSLPVDPALKANLEGALWLVRRTFLNRAPSIAPVQLTGQLTGPITGRLNAVDPEGDPLIFHVTRAPKSGVLQVNSDGTYTYTPGAGFAGVDSFHVVALDAGLHVNVLDPFRAWGASARPLINQRAITFDFRYGSGAEYWTDDRRAALQQAADDLIVYFIVARPVVLTYDVTALDDEASPTLASAGSDLVSEEAGYWRTIVQHKLLSGVDANGGAADGEIEWNFGSAWALGDTVSPEEFDFASTAMHELLHSFGFLSYVGEAGDNDDTARTRFDSFLVTADGRRPINANFTWNTAYDPNLTGGNGGLFFGGRNAVAAYGAFVPIFTPNPWEEGSSGSHLDDFTFTGADQQLMNAKTDTGLGVRTLSAIEIGILRDLGYRVVPHSPLYGAALIGVVFLRRKRNCVPKAR